MKLGFFGNQDSGPRTQGHSRRRLPSSLPSRLLHSSLRPLDLGAALPDSIRQAQPDRGRKNGFTLFELLAVLTVISVMLVLIVGSYGSWGTAHALTGATRIVEAGLTQARTIAITRRAYVAFSYGSSATNHNRVVTGFQSFLCEPTNNTTSVETILKTILTPGRDLTYISEDDINISPAVPLQRITSHVRLAYVRESDVNSVSPVTYGEMTFFFRPDGSVLSDPADTHAHYIIVYTQERFHRGGYATSPLLRYMRIDLASGLVTIQNPEVTQ